MEATREVMERRKVMGGLVFFSCVLIFFAILAYMIGRSKGRKEEQWCIEQEEEKYKQKVYELLRREEEGLLSRGQEKELNRMREEFCREYEIE